MCKIIPGRQFSVITIIKSRQKLKLEYFICIKLRYSEHNSNFTFIYQSQRASHNLVETVRSVISNSNRNIASRSITKVEYKKGRNLMPYIT